MASLVSRRPPGPTHDSTVPAGTKFGMQPYPRLKPWAMFFRPSGTGRDSAKSSHARVFDAAASRLPQEERIHGQLVVEHANNPPNMDGEYSHIGLFCKLTVRRT